MKYLRSYKQFESKETYHQLFDLNMIHLWKVADKIYAVSCTDDNVKNMLFCRFQEHYESPEFKQKKFKMTDYIKWYKKDNDKFTYTDDWSGFNLPSETIEDCLSGIEDENDWDIMMRSIIETIKSEESGKFYLLGVEEMVMGGEDVLDHEISHGMFYTDPQYKSEIFELIRQMDLKDREMMTKIILDYGYDESVVDDEIGAYLTTGLASKMKNQGLEKYFNIFGLVFNKFKNQHVKGGPKEIKINWI